MKHLLLLILLFTGLTASAYDFVVGGVYYYAVSSDDKTCEVAQPLTTYIGNIVIPSEVVYNGKTWSVTSIGASAFSDCSGLTGITIPNSVTSIGRNAFWGCSGLTSITIPNSVTNIGKFAFAYCSALENLVIEDGTGKLEVGDELFSSCPLKSLYLGRDLSCESSPFYGKSTLTEVIIGNTVTNIGNNAFEGCSGLTSIIIPNSVTSIGRTAFNRCI